MIFNQLTAVTTRKMSNGKSTVPDEILDGIFAKEDTYAGSHKKEFVVTSFLPSNSSLEKHSKDQHTQTCFCTCQSETTEQKAGGWNKLRG